MIVKYPAFLRTEFRCGYCCLTFIQLFHKIKNSVFSGPFFFNRELLFGKLAYFQQHGTTAMTSKRFWDTFLSSGQFLFGICM